MKITFVLTFLVLSTCLKDIGFKLQLLPSVSAAIGDEVYDGCGYDRFCFGASISQNTKNCIEKESCDMVVSVRTTANVTNVRLQGVLKNSPELWIGAGLSSDTRMGDDLVIGCVKAKNGSSSATSSSYFWNVEGAGYGEFIEPTNAATITLLKHWSINNGFYCEMAIDNKIEYKTHAYDLIKGKFHILLAMGRSPATVRILSGHTPTNRWASEDLKSLSTVEVYYATDSSRHFLNKVHGILMVTSFMFFMSVGSFVSRFYKQTFISVKIRGRRFWFIVHMSSMYCAGVLACAALVLVIISTYKQKQAIFPPLSGLSISHVYVGFSVCFIMFLQSTVIWWNPPFRKKLTLLHSLFGIVTIWMGWYCITFVREDTGYGPDIIIYLGTAWIGTYVLFIVGMTGLQLWDDSVEREDAIDEDPCRAVKIPMKIISMGEDPNKPLRVAVLITFVLVMLALALITAIAVGSPVFYS